MLYFTDKIRISFVALIVISMTAFLSYVLVQQSLRMNANDPQIELAENTTAGLASGLATSTTSQKMIDIKTSLSPFIVIYDRNGAPVTWTGVINGQPPVPPRGVFEYTDKNNEDRLTFEPEPGVRDAAVIKKFTTATSSGYVLAARSLREVEIRENNAFLLSALAWTGAMVLSFLFIWIPGRKNNT